MIRKTTACHFCGFCKLLCLMFGTHVSPCWGSVLSSLSLGFIDQVGAEAELLCHFTGSCLDGCKVYNKSILLGERLATKSITEQESTHAIRRARKKEGKSLVQGFKKTN